MCKHSISHIKVVCTIVHVITNLDSSSLAALKVNHIYYHIATFSNIIWCFPLSPILTIVQFSTILNKPTWTRQFGRFYLSPKTWSEFYKRKLFIMQACWYDDNLFWPHRNKWTSYSSREREMNFIILCMTQSEKY